MKVVVVGHSHIGCMQRAAELHKDSTLNGVQFGFLQLRTLPHLPAGGGSQPIPVDPSVLRREMEKTTEGASWVVLCVDGNQHSLVGMLNSPERAEVNKGSLKKRRSRKAKIYKLLKTLNPRLRRDNNKSIHQGALKQPVNTPEDWALLDTLLTRHTHWLDALLPLSSQPVAVLPPPPIKQDDWILKYPGVFKDKIDKLGVRPAHLRQEFWRYQYDFCRRDTQQRGLVFIDLPEEGETPNGLLKPSYYADDPTHGNVDYGQLLLAHLAAWANPGSKAVTDEPIASDPKEHPYTGRPPYTFWRQAISATHQVEVDPVVEAPFRLAPTDRIATAGSCFAQHISRRLSSAGFNFLRMEPQSDVDQTERYDFSARYGNIYTVRQLLQLFRSAFGRFKPITDVWPAPNGGFCDAFRPRIETQGFASEVAVRDARKAHLSAVRAMFETLEVFVFTLGLTECWTDRRDGSVFPLAPGVAGGQYDPDIHEFKNFGVAEISEDLNSFISELRQVNPTARIILTVSPVPLAATYEPKHVLVSNTYSKSVLRVVAEQAQQSHPDVYYFPSYELITGNHTSGRYFGTDRRSVTEEGVDHVMRLFMHHLAGQKLDLREPNKSNDAADTADETHRREMEALANAECDEALLDR